jgi:hypothetical protein
MAPRLGGELPPYTTKPKKPRKVMASPNFRSTGTPGTKNFVQRMPGGAHQRKPSAAGVGMGRVLGTIRAKLTAPRKPAK